MSNPIEPALQRRIDDYLTRLRRALVDLPPEEVAEIVREIHGHIVERAESMDLLDDAALTNGTILELTRRVDASSAAPYPVAVETSSH